MISFINDEDGKEHQRLLKVINGALKSAIHDHGPITKEMMGSASKRVVGALKSLEKSKIEQNGVNNG